VAQASPPDGVPPIEPTPVAGPPAVPPPPPAPGFVDPYATPPAYQPPGQYAPAGPYPPSSPYGAPPQAIYYPQAPYNTLAIVGFVLAFFVSLGAVICGHIALSQIRRTGERGHGLALAAVIIGYCGIGFWVLYIIGFALLFATTAATSSSY
jgi:hypothetical protein